MNCPLLLLHVLNMKRRRCPGVRAAQAAFLFIFAGDISCSAVLRGRCPITPTCFHNLCCWVPSQNAMNYNVNISTQITVSLVDVARRQFLIEWLQQGNGCVRKDLSISESKFSYWELVVNFLFDPLGPGHWGRTRQMGWKQSLMLFQSFRDQLSIKHLWQFHGWAQ